MRLGVDTGGTFTDFVWLNADGHFQIHKQLSTPPDPSQAILSGVAILQVPEAAGVVHGSTVATNALLERRGARTALITTVGFADVLEIGRQNRPDLYALVPRKPEPLVPRGWRFEVNERITSRGEILVPLDRDSLQPILDRLAAERIESVAICLLFSFLRPEHERQLRDKIVQFDGLSAGQAVQAPPGGLHISLSSDILPEYREYERTATTVINAYVAPLMSHYLSRLSDGLSPRRLAVMQSNGGVISAQKAGSEAARSVLSGPAGGVVGARFVAGQAGYEHIITFDMGGTSTDVALCPGRLPTTAEGEIAGMPLRLPMIDIHTVGAGGGSLAYMDPGGGLHVGPQSAGADPGPSCYGRKIGEWRLEIGTSVNRVPITTTDANLVLGRLDADHFLGGSMRLEKRKAEAALAELSASMGLSSLEAAAWGVIQVANANMERAIRRISVERGYDPRRFTLVAFGGAGPLHACDLAFNLQIPRVLIPGVPGVLSALGMLIAAPTKDYSQTVMVRTDDAKLQAEEWMRARFQALEERALREMLAEGHQAAALTFQHSLDMRYVGQSHELTIPCNGSEAQRAVDERFHRQHLSRYGYQQPREAVEIVNMRLAVTAPVTVPELSPEALETASADDARVGEKQVYFNQRPVATDLYERAKLRPGNKIDGPAIIFQYDTTTVLPPDWEATVDPFNNLILAQAE